MKMQVATHGWKYKEQFGETNVPGRVHGACDTVAGENVLCATDTRTAGNIIGTCYDVLATEMTRDDRKNRISSGDDASVTMVCMR